MCCKNNFVAVVASATSKICETSTRHLTGTTGTGTIDCSVFLHCSPPHDKFYTNSTSSFNIYCNSPLERWRRTLGESTHSTQKSYRLSFYRMTAVRYGGWCCEIRFSVESWRWSSRRRRLSRGFVICRRSQSEDKGDESALQSIT